MRRYEKGDLVSGVGNQAYKAPARAFSCTRRDSVRLRVNVQCQPYWRGFWRGGTQGIHPLFEEDVLEVWDYNASAEKRDTEGGASSRSVREQAAKLKAYLSSEGLA